MLVSYNGEKKNKPALNELEPSAWVNVSVDLFASWSWLSSFGDCDNSFHRFVFTPHEAWHAAILFYNFHAGSALWCVLNSVPWPQLWEWAEDTWNSYRNKLHIPFTLFQIEAVQ